jgi:hypothetical protein
VSHSAAFQETATLLRSVLRLLDFFTIC